MGRTTPAKGIHSSPEKAGALRLVTEEVLPKDVTVDETLKTLVDISLIAQGKVKEYKGLWTEDLFISEVNDYFQYISENGVKPSKASLNLWLGCSRSQYWEWSTKPEKYGYKSSVLEMAHLLMESSYIGRGEKYPTFNAFLLKTAHGYIEANRLDITSNGKDITNADDVKDLVSKLGLDKHE